MVTWFHFTSQAPPALRQAGSAGWMGVEMFFVISGFVIPYSMQGAGYGLRDLDRFILKRIIRLDPPYVVSLALVVLLNFLSTMSSMYHGVAFRVSYPQLLLHLGYVNVFCGYPWMNPVFWTLAIELQFYLLIALLYPLLASPERGRWLTVMVLAAAAGLGSHAHEFIIMYAHPFLLGILSFKWRAGQLRRWEYGIAFALLSVGVAVNLGVPAAILTGLTTLLVAFNNREFRLLRVLGTLSYSLYLLHVPVGGRVVNLGSRFVHSTLGYTILVLVALVASLVASWFLYVTVERPSRRLSSRIRFRGAHRAGAGSVIPLAAA